MGSKKEVRKGNKGNMEWEVKWEGKITKKWNRKWKGDLERDIRESVMGSEKGDFSRFKGIWGLIYRIGSELGKIWNGKGKLDQIT